MGEISEGRRLSRHDLELVIRRAAELEVATGGDAPELTEGDVLRIAGEVGLSEPSVRRALAEHYAISGSGSLLAERGWAPRLYGPGLVTATRGVTGEAEDLRERVESHFQANESLRILRRTGSGSLWEPDPGVLASIMRSVDLFGRGYQLAKQARAIELHVAPLGEGTSQVTLTADLGKERAGWFWGGGVALGGALAAGAGVGGVLATELAAMAAAGLPVWAVTAWLSRRAYVRAVEKMRLCLEGVLDRLEHGDPLAPPRTSLRDLLK